MLEKNVRVGPDGVFVADRKVADLEQVVENIVRADVAEIKTARIESNPVGCAFAGYLGGGLIGGLPGILVGHAVGRDTGPALVGMIVGWSVGSVYVYRKCRHKPERVIYRAP
jgi:outer membrane lipoprotein SlyB